jgi:hypothetical protein
MGFWSTPDEKARIEREKAAIANGGAASASNLAGMSWNARQEVLRREQDARAAKARQQERKTK